MPVSVRRVSLLLLGSGFCALVYQVAWLRMLRLVFGSSTPASAAVVAIFMAGLGLGSHRLGPRADRKAQPLLFYAQLELGIAASAAASPLLVLLVERLYVLTGGTALLGSTAGAVVRLALSALVLGLPTYLMGGTLPAVARAVSSTGDAGRRALGWLYGANTVGAVLGALITTLFSLEVLGIRRTIWVAALVNLLVAVVAQRTAHRAATVEPDEAVSGAAPARVPRAAFPLLAAGVVGFAFFLLELIWYRMLAPLLGGSSYTFGLILAVALAGIGAGGLLYGGGARERRPDLLAFATTCALEALVVAIPLALGDRVAVFALVLRDLSAAGFAGLVLSWTTVLLVVVLPASLVAGYQFPLLVAVLGAGRQRVGRQVGHAYAANTVGAIAGSLAGGFGLIPLLSAPGAWRLAALLLVALAIASVLLGLRPARNWRRALLPAAACAAALACVLARGPSAFWRHSPIGAGRQELEHGAGPNELEDLIHLVRRITLWEEDGRESSVALQAEDGYSFLVNGKSDGSARQDAPTQVMSGLVASLLHPAPRTALVIGLGTGSTAGWLAQVPEIERVDVVEIEPAIRRVAEACSPVNREVLSNPKVRLILGDAREVLLTSREQYDIIFSEPSNPYRAGIASLFTRDFYQAVANRLDHGGLLVQWLQGYEVDPQVVRTAYATLESVFGEVESWQVHRADLLLVASREPIIHDLERLERRLAEEPYASAMDWVWGVEGVEAFYGAYVASPAFAAAVATDEGEWINTDDRPIIEFGFARNVGRFGLFRIDELRRLVTARGEHRPPGVHLDWNVVEDRTAARAIVQGSTPGVSVAASPQVRTRTRARLAYVNGDLAGACAIWSAQESEPETPADRLLWAECLADAADPRTPRVAEPLLLRRPVEAQLIKARWHRRRGEWDEAAASLERAFALLRTMPWAYRPLVFRGLQLALEVGAQEGLSARLFEALEPPFAVGLADERRRLTLVEMAQLGDFPSLCRRAFEPLEPDVPWRQGFLESRARCYAAAAPRLAPRARRDLERFLADAAFPLEVGLLPSATH